MARHRRNPADQELRKLMRAYKASPTRTLRRKIDALRKRMGLPTLPSRKKAERRYRAARRATHDIFTWVSYDTWGNEEDGWEVNNVFPSGTFFTLPKGYDDEQLLQALKDNNILDQRTVLEETPGNQMVVAFDDAGMGELIDVLSVPDGHMPIGRVERVEGHERTQIGVGEPLFRYRQLSKRELADKGYLTPYSSRSGSGRDVLRDLRMNPDEDLRDLQRKALEGDAMAQERLRRELARRGQTVIGMVLTPEEEARLAEIRQVFEDGSAPSSFGGPAGQFRGVPIALQRQAIEANLRLKFSKGQYDSAKSVKLWGYLVQAALDALIGNFTARRSAQGYGDSRMDREDRRNMLRIYSTKIRKELARRLALEFEQNIHLPPQRTLEPCRFRCKVMPGSGSLRRHDYEFLTKKDKRLADLCAVCGWSRYDADRRRRELRS